VESFPKYTDRPRNTARQNQHLDYAIIVSDNAESIEINEFRDSSRVGARSCSKLLKPQLAQ